LPIFFLSDEREIFRIFELLLGDKTNLAFAAKDDQECFGVSKSELDRTMDNNTSFDLVALDH